MTTTPKTIQIFLPHGNPRGIRIADITTRMVQAVLIPRKDLVLAKDRPELTQAAVYFLFSEEEGSLRPLLYIGETETAWQRLTEHNAKMAFWDKAVVVTTKNDAFTKVHGRYLEAHCHEQARVADRATLQNTQRPVKPKVPESLRAEILDAFEVLEVLLATLVGHSVFEPLKPVAAAARLVCRRSGLEAYGNYTEDGFVVYAGSRIARTINERLRKGSRAMREPLLEQGILEAYPDHYVLLQDRLFKTPSGASCFVIGAESNGWTEWKDQDGKTLDELSRKPHEESVT